LNCGRNRLLNGATHCIASSSFLPMIYQRFYYYYYYYTIFSRIREERGRSRKKEKRERQRRKGEVKSHGYMRPINEAHSFYLSLLSQFVHIMFMFPFCCFCVLFSAFPTSESYLYCNIPPPHLLSWRRWLLRFYIPSFFYVFLYIHIIY